DEGDNEIFAVDTNGKINIKTGEGSSVGSVVLLAEAVDEPTQVLGESTEADSGSEEQEIIRQINPEANEENGTVEYFIPTTAVTKDSQILLSVNSYVYYEIEKVLTDDEVGFRLIIDETLPKNIKIQYLIVN
ncbi:hypothetical protein N9C96_02720, partial [bacterium]|nr:hypothetical protein [bacterium]